MSALLFAALCFFSGPALAGGFTCSCEIPRYGNNPVEAGVSCPGSVSIDDLRCTGSVGGTYYLNIECEHITSREISKNYTQMSSDDPTSPILCELR